MPRHRFSFKEPLKGGGLLFETIEAPLCFCPLFGCKELKEGSVFKLKELVRGSSRREERVPVKYAYALKTPKGSLFCFDLSEPPAFGEELCKKGVFERALSHPVFDVSLFAGQKELTLRAKVPFGALELLRALFKELWRLKGELKEGVYVAEELEGFLRTRGLFERFEKLFKLRRLRAYSPLSVHLLAREKKGA